MTQYIDKSALVAEINRIKKEECPIDTYEGRNKLFYFEQFLSFLDTLEVKEVQEEPVSEELEEAANSCSSCIYLEEVLSDDDKEVLKERLVNTFKAGAQWQKEHLINKATEWLCYNYDKYIRVVGSSIYPAYAELCKKKKKAMGE